MKEISSTNESLESLQFSSSRKFVSFNLNLHAADYNVSMATTFWCGNCSAESVRTKVIIISLIFHHHRTEKYCFQELRILLFLIYPPQQKNNSFLILIDWYHDFQYIAEDRFWIKLKFGKSRAGWMES